MDHTWVAGGASGEFPDYAQKPSVNGPNRPNGTYVIRFRNRPGEPKHKDFLRGYGYQGGGSSNFNYGVSGFGRDYKQAVANSGVTQFAFSGFGEVLPYEDNQVSIDPNVVDTFGIPVLRISMAWKENEKKMIPDMGYAAAEMLEAAGAQEHPSVLLPRSRPRLRHPRDGHRPDGRRPEELGPQPVPADARHR